MSASKALEHIRRHGTSRDVQMALYYVTRGRTAPLLELARSVTPAEPSVADPRPVPDRAAAPAPTGMISVELPV